MTRTIILCLRVSQRSLNYEGANDMYDISLVCNVAGFCMCCLTIALLVVAIFACIIEITFKDGDKVFFRVKTGSKALFTAPNKSLLPVLLKLTFVFIILYALFFQLINLMAAEQPVTADQSRGTLSDRLSGLRSSQAFPELAAYTAYNCQFVIKYMERNWFGKKAYIEKVNLKKETDHFIRVRIYLLSVHPVGNHYSIIVQYFRESWYDREDAQFIDGELHPYSQHKKALVDLNLFWNDPEYVGKIYKVNNTVLRNMTQIEKEIILANADRLLFVLNSGRSFP